MMKFASILAQRDGSFWLPPQVSTVAEPIDNLFYFVYWLSVFFFALIVVLMVVFAFRYRRRKGGAVRGAGPTHNLPLELAWTIIPLILVIVIFSMGFKGYIDMSVAPANAYEIQVTGQKWNWTFTYPNGYVDSNLHVPVNRPIRLVMSSEDVIHSFFIPAFRVKRDVVPGRYHKMWFTANEPGEYIVYCAEYCGTKHSDMLATCVVHPDGDFEPWLEKASNFLDDPNLTPAKKGEMIYQRRGCTQCHSVDGTPGIGPTFQGIFGREEVMQDGTKVVADENYIRESILNPNAKIVAGYDAVMPTYQGRLKDEEITVLIDFMKSLKAEE